MKTIKFIGILAAASFLFSFNAFAQEDGNRDADGKVVRGPYVTNSAFDNTFIGLGAGLNSVIEKEYGLGKMGLATEINFGKWFTPAIGARIGWHGLNNTSKSGELDKDPFHYIHADFLWNLSNSIDGYKQTRFWNFIPYVSGGLSLIKHHDLKNKVAALERENAQLKNKIADLENQLAPFKNLVDGQTYLFQNGRFTAVEATVASPATVYFDLGSAKISDREKAHLEFFANSVVDNATKLLLTGSADKQTGTSNGNQKLSVKRVDAVKALLEKLGANGDNIETVANGDTKNVFDTPAKNRCVVIEVK